jgi:hypothetical protein
LGCHKPPEDLVGDRLFKAVNRKSVNDLLEKPSYQKSLGSCLGQTSALEVIEIVLFKRTHRGRVTANNVVTENFKIRN